MLRKGRIRRCGDTDSYIMPLLRDVALFTEKPQLSLEQRAEEIERKAYEEGFSAGEKAGLEFGEQKSSVLLTGLQSIINDLTTARKKTLAELEPEIISLVVSIAKKIIYEELSIRPELIGSIVREAMRKIEKTGRITIRINPALCSLFEKIKPELLKLHSDISIDADPMVPVNSPLIIGPAEEVVTDIDEQIENIMEGISNVSAGN
ncbi:MAG: hypothetical protein HY756_12855 [Nitrospirae bacterium]|nr:hypothetical protein [Nitrospirota bacterium]